MNRSTRICLVLWTLCLAAARPGEGQVISLAVGTGPVFLPGSGTLGDWQGMLSVGVQQRAVGVRLEAMYTGVPGADLLALTANVLWVVRRRVATQVEPYLIAGVGSYVKYSESRFGLNAGAGIRRQVGWLRLFAEARYHHVTSRFDEGRLADTFVPVSVGVALGHGR
ncbi:MAG: hypothetical protein ABJC36_04085 [Gemmatimonadales bacterium]